ncbi:hypothetical protein BTVI_56765 [Pitangus sulphuratus]|nr:hypothetical protein BTVI_56765 [Pitangus sulphuratus]
MGPSKASVFDDAFAFSTRGYRNEGKALQTQLQFNRNVPAVPENLALRFSHPRPIIIEKLKASSDQRNPAGSEDPNLKSSGMFSVVSEEKLKLAIQLAKRDIKRRHLEEQVKQQVFGNVVSKPPWTQKSQQQNTEVFASPGNKNALKPQTRLPGRDTELLDPEIKQRLCTRRQQQAARSARMLYVLQQQVKEIQDDLDKLSPHTIKHTKKSQAVSRLAAAHRGAVRTLQAFANQFTDQTDEQIPAHYKELGSLIRQLSLCSAKLEGDSSISDIIIDILLQVEGTLKPLKSRQVRPQGKRAGFREPTISFQLKETKRPAKESRIPCPPPKPPALPVPPKRSQTVSPAPCADKVVKEVQEWLEPLSDSTQRHRESVRRRITQIVYTDSHFWAQEDKIEQHVASVPERLTSPHPIQITKLIGHTELETNILFEKPFDGNDIDENKEAEEKLQTGNEILHPLPLNSLQKTCSVSLSVPNHMLQSILDYNSRYKHHLKLISHEVVGSFDPWQIADRYMNCLCDFEVNVSADKLIQERSGEATFKFQTESQRLLALRLFLYWY